jgi:hypothetical protein
MPAIRHADCAAHAKSALCEVQPDTHFATNAIVGVPLNERRIDATLHDEIFYQAADGILWKSSDDCRAQAEAFAHPTGDIVFASAFPGIELARRPDAALAGIEAKHHLSK